MRYIVDIMDIQDAVNSAWQEGNDSTPASIRAANLAYQRCLTKPVAYQGYVNKATWAVSLYSTNDRNLYEQLRDLDEPTSFAFFWADLYDLLVRDPLALTEEYRGILVEIGDITFVDWGEVYDHVKGN